MTYKNTRTGFVFSSPCEIKAEGWELLDPRPTLKKNEEVKPAKTKRIKKDE